MFFTDPAVPIKFSFHSSRISCQIPRPTVREIQNKEKIEQKKQLEFSEKIDELNQETDSLLNEIDKWQT